MRLLLFVLYYGLAVLLGFTLRGRFDAAIYRRPHMQRRLVVWAADVVTYYEQGGDELVFPPSTLDAEAWSRKPRPPFPGGSASAAGPAGPSRPVSGAASGGPASAPASASSSPAVPSPAPEARPVEPS